MSQSPATIEVTARDITPAPAQVEPKLPRLTPNMHQFVMAYMRFGVPAKAYMLAYKVKAEATPRWVYGEASRLLENPKVALNIDWLRKQAMTDDLNSILREFDQNRNGALEDRNYSAANGATRGKAQALGLIPHDRQNAGSFGNVTIFFVLEDKGLL